MQVQRDPGERFVDFSFTDDELKNEALCIGFIDSLRRILPPHSISQLSKGYQYRVKAQHWATVSGVFRRLFTDPKQTEIPL